MVTAALYYVRPEDEEGGEATMVDDGVETETGGERQMPTDDAVTEGGGERRMSTDDAVTEEGSKQGENCGTSGGYTYNAEDQEPAETVQEVDAATRRAGTAKSAGDEVAASIATLDAAQLDRRRRQSELARVSLAQRRQQYREMQVYLMDERARVRLVQRTQEPAAGATLDPDVEADVLAEDGLPTATMMVEGERLPVKLDSGLWAFEKRNVFGQTITVKACIIDGCTDEFLVGVDFLK
ncbi:hypothetical protein PInf_004397 [Phytophthora infestans]|nr:hypothetical protein PInf_004397 [Phytophthora infestans]